MLKKISFLRYVNLNDQFNIYEKKITDLEKQLQQQASELTQVKEINNKLLAMNNKLLEETKVKLDEMDMFLEFVCSNVKFDHIIECINT